MNVTCEKCNKRYSIADDKVRGKSVKIRCKQCQNLISVQGPPAASAGASGGASGGAAVAAPSPWAEESTRAMPALDNTSQWFAMVKGKQLGPLDVKALEGKVKSGELTLRTYLWKQGMGDWKRASDVPELSPVFAGVPSGASTARPVSSPARAVRDVAVALQTPSPEITKKSNGNGHGLDRSSGSSPGVGAKPRVASQPKVQPVPKAVVAPAPAPAPVAAKPERIVAPLSDLFGDEGGAEPTPTGEHDVGGDDGAAKASTDPFAALGDNDAVQAPPPGEATKFFIAQAGVNKRNPWWKIALFVVGFPAGAVGVLFVLSTLHIGPVLEVTRTDENGEEVKESFFSAGGVAGLKDLLSGDAKRRKAAAEQARLAAQASADQRRRAPAAAGTDPAVAPPKGVDPALALIYGNNDNRGPTKIHVRASDRGEQAATDTSAAGLSQEATQKVIADKIKAFQGCVDQALRRNPNLAVGSIEVVANVGTSGAVTSANIAPPKYENSDWGSCMREVAKRIVFPKSDGETEVRIPLKVGVAVPL